MPKLTTGKKTKLDHDEETIWVGLNRQESTRREQGGSAAAASPGAPLGVPHRRGKRSVAYVTLRCDDYEYAGKIEAQKAGERHSIEAPRKSKARRHHNLIDDLMMPIIP